MSNPWPVEIGASLTIRAASMQEAHGAVAGAIAKALTDGLVRGITRSAAVPKALSLSGRARKTSPRKQS